MKKKFSIVVQGPVESIDEIKKKIKLINSLFPSAEIIFSTWGNGAVEKINDSSIIIYNKEMESDPADGDKWAINFRRQCVSVLAGLRYSSFEYVVKMRSDSILINNDLEKYLEKFEKSKKKLLITRKLIPYPHPFYSEDYFMAGRKDDLLELWTNALNHEQCHRYYKDFIPSIYDKYTRFYARYHPEQIIYIAQFGGENYSREQKSFFKYNDQFAKLEIVNYCIGRKNIGLSSIKHKFTINDWCPHEFTLFPLNKIRVLLSILYGFVQYISLKINDYKLL